MGISSPALLFLQLRLCSVMYIDRVLYFLKNFMKVLVIIMYSILIFDNRSLIPVDHRYAKIFRMYIYDCNYFFIYEYIFFSFFFFISFLIKNYVCDYYGY